MSAAKKPGETTNNNSTSKTISISKHLQWIYLAIITIVFVPMYQSTFDTKVAFLGDNAGYYVLGKSIAGGHGYSDIYVKAESPATHFPPGYPTILAGVRLIAGDSTDAAKITNGIFLYASLIILFFFFRKIGMNIHLSFVITLLLIVNAHLLQFGTWIMSEVPYLLFSSLALFLLSKSDFTKNPLKNVHFLIFIVLMSASFYIRSLGVAVLGAAVFYFLIKLNWKYLITTIAGFILLYIPWIIRGRDLPSSTYVKNFTLKNFYVPDEGVATFGDYVERFLGNLERYLAVEIPSGIFGYEGEYTDTYASSQIFLGVLILAICIFAIIRLKNYNWLVLGYMLATFFVLLLWPSVWYGIRFMFGVIPFLVALFIYGIYDLLILVLRFLKVQESIFAKSILPFAFLLLIPNLYGNVQVVQEKSDQALHPIYKQYFGIAKWAKKGLPENSVVISRKPRLFYMYSGRYGENISRQSDLNLFLKSMKRKEATHIVYYQDGLMQRYFVPAYQAAPEKFPVLQKTKNPEIYLIAFRPDLGFQGTYKDNKMHGEGVYVFPNGNTFEGIWEDGKKSGPGVLKDKNGNILQKGIWKNDQFVGQ